MMSIHRLLGGVMLVLGLLAGIAAPTHAETDAEQSSGATEQQVDVVEAVGVLDGPLVSYLVSAIEKANAEGSVAVVIRLDTPGALGGDIDAVVAAINRSAIPVVVYVGTPGARAFGAGVRVAAAAHVLALAPATTYGVATPQDLGRTDAMSVLEVADLLGRTADDGTPSGSFLTQAADGAAVVAVPDGETGTAVIGDAQLPDRHDTSRIRTLDERALAAEGIADIVAPTLQGVLSRLTDVQVQTAAGPVTLNVDPVTANVRFVNPSLLVRILHTAASPTLAYLLLLAGALALFFEIFQPGFGVAGVAAIAVLGLGVYSLFPLPVAAVWMVVAMVGLLLLAYDLAIAGLSWPTALGTLLLGVGSFRMWLVEALSPPAWLLVLGTLSAMVFFGFMMTTVLRAQGNQALAGAGQVEGKVGIVRSVLNPDGHVFVGGALWRARAPESLGKVQTGTRVRIVGLNDQLTLDVAVMEGEPEADH